MPGLDKMEKFAAYEQRMKKENLSQAAIDAFKGNFDQLVSGVTGLVSRLGRCWIVRFLPPASVDEHATCC